MKMNNFVYNREKFLIKLNLRIKHIYIKILGAIVIIRKIGIRMSQKV